MQQLVNATIDFCADTKVPLQEGENTREEDRKTLEEVTSLQVYAKCAIARKQGPFERDMASADVIRTVCEELSVGLKSSQAYLDNIGRFEIEGQVFVPALPKNPVHEIPDGWTRTSFTSAQGTLYVNLVGYQGPVPDPTSFDVMRLPEDRQRIIGGRAISVENTVKRYSRLLERIGKKMAHALVPLDFVSGKGTPAQLVGCYKNPQTDSRQEVEAFCMRKVSPSVLLLGAGCEFGLNSGTPSVAPDSVMHDPKGPIHVETTVRTGSFFTKLMNVNRKRKASDAR